MYRKKRPVICPSCGVKILSLSGCCYDLSIICRKCQSLLRLNVDLNGNMMISSHSLECLNLEKEWVANN